MSFHINTTKPIEKPSEFGTIADGLHEVTVQKAEYTTSSTGNKMLKLSFKDTKSGQLIFDQIMEDPTKQVNVYRLSRLLAALKITIDSAVELRDLAKVIKPNSRLVVATVTKPGSQFTNIDINKYEGYYAPEDVASDPKVVVEASSNQAPKAQAPAQPELDINSDDSTF